MSPYANSSFISTMNTTTLSGGWRVSAAMLEYWSYKSYLPENVPLTPNPSSKPNGKIYLGSDTLRGSNQRPYVE